jgi:hypothetical protein
MATYLQSLVQRLKQHSKSLADTAGFIEIPWAFIDDTGTRVTYIFRRQGDILVSRQGDVTRGNWEYLPQIQSLLIQAQGKAHIYNQALLLDSSIMVLRKDDTEELFALANPAKIADLDILGYLESFEQKAIKSPGKKGSFEVFETKDGRKIRLINEVSDSGSFALGNTALDENSELVLSDGLYELKDPDYIIEVKGGKILHVRENFESFVYILLIVIVLLIITVILLSSLS